MPVALLRLINVDFPLYQIACELEAGSDCRAESAVRNRQFAAEPEKRGKPQALVTRYRELDLLEKPTTPEPAPIYSDANCPRDCLEGKGMLKRWGLAVAQIVVNAVRTIPKFVEIELSISLVCSLPTLTFALKGKGMSIHELFEALRAPVCF